MDYFQKGRYPEAIIQFQSAVQMDKRFASAHYQLAQCYLRQAEWLQAQTELLTTVELDPRNSQAQLDLGQFMFQGGNSGAPRSALSCSSRTTPQMLKRKFCWPPATPNWAICRMLSQRPDKRFPRHRMMRPPI